MKNITKKMSVLLALVLFGTSNATASMQSQATLTDIKESLFYLINDYEDLKKRVQALEEKSIALNNEDKAIQKSFEELKKNYNDVFKKHKKSVVTEIKSFKEKIETMNKLIDTYTKKVEIELSCKSQDDLIIEEFIRKNSK